MKHQNMNEIAPLVKCNIFGQENISNYGKRDVKRKEK
jgi:hypothetical protein